ncbi:MAG: hypothetical protein NVS4B5_00820 [Vulcanimicrobiaceae bacterium]
MGLDAAAIETIVTHMNDDHADAVLGYAKRLGGIANAQSATLRALDARGMTIEAIVDSSPETITIAFDRPLADAREARETLIALAR